MTGAHLHAQHLLNWILKLRFQTDNSKALGPQSERVFVPFQSHVMDEVSVWNWHRELLLEVGPGARYRFAGLCVPWK